MIFVDSSVFVLALGRENALKAPAQEFFAEALRFGEQLAVSAEVLREMLHVYRRRGELPLFDAARSLVANHGMEIWNLADADVDRARSLADYHPELSARDLCHLAACLRRGADNLKTYDRALERAFRRGRNRTVG